MLPKRILLIALLLVTGSVAAQDHHPAMENKWWINVGTFLAKHDFDASASGTIAGATADYDLEGSLGLDESPNLFMGELGWRFAEKWDLALQYFRARRTGSKVLEDSFEWQGNLYDVGVRLDAATQFEITRFFFARRFKENGPHDLRLGAGIHWLELSAEVAGLATLNDQSTEFRRSAATASVPVPNLGVWYRYSPSDRWMISTRLDWLSASIDHYSGDIWNASAGVNYRFSEHLGVGASYQYLSLGGKLTEDNWRGKISTTYTGPYLYVNGFW